jgi:hypothetical protein
MTYPKSEEVAMIRIRDLLSVLFFSGVQQHHFKLISGSGVGCSDVGPTGPGAGPVQTWNGAVGGT